MNLRNKLATWRWYGVGLSLWMLTAHADKISNEVAELSDEFLEYLGSLEGDDDNWTDFTTQAVAARASSSVSSATTALLARTSQSARGSSSSATSKVGK